MCTTFHGSSSAGTAKSQCPFPCLDASNLPRTGGKEQSWGNREEEAEDLGNTRWLEESSHLKPRSKRFAIRRPCTVLFANFKVLFL
jgi:hypothetical protein